jgi:hypothetical protein
MVRIVEYRLNRYDLVFAETSDSWFLMPTFAAKDKTDRIEIESLATGFYDAVSDP